MRHRVPRCTDQPPQGTESTQGQCMNHEWYKGCAEEQEQKLAAFWSGVMLPCMGRCVKPSEIVWWPVYNGHLTATSFCECFYVTAWQMFLSSQWLPLYKKELSWVVKCSSSPCSFPSNWKFEGSRVQPDLTVGRRSNTPGEWARRFFM